MIAVLLISSSFLIILFLAIIILVVNMKRYTDIREKENAKRIDELRQDIADLKMLFTDGVVEVMGNIKKFLK
jgi:preprotein translocase subunit SecG